jgi:hypothetical protein
MKITGTDFEANYEDIEMMYMLGEITKDVFDKETAKSKYNKQKARQTQKDMNDYAN